MASSSAPNKHGNVGEGAKTVEIVDRISSLPDSVLCNILSFLPTKCAVGTRILSTRWKHLFTSIPNLDLDDSLLLRPRKASKNPAREMTTFMNFVERMLVLRKAACIDRFRLKCGRNIDVSRVNAWICAALCRNIQELDLFIPVKEFAMLPRDLFTCRTLVVLKLGEKFVLNVPIKVCLPNLKILHLNDIEFVDDDSIHRLISCPVLEELVIQGCGWDDIHTFNIFAPALKSLTLNVLLEGGAYSNEFSKYEIVINAPNLVYLHYCDFVPEGYTVKNLPSLVRAHIDVGFSSEQLKDTNPNYDESITQVLRGISEVQFLHMSEYFMEAIVLSHQTIPTFFNVTHLELGVSYKVGWQMLPDLLKSFPILETLAFVEGFLHADYRQNPFCQWDPPQCVPPCLLLLLGTIEIKSFRGHEEGMTIVEYFLKNARVLKKMTIHTSGMTEKEELKISKKLLTFPRGSTACQVVIS